MTEAEAGITTGTGTSEGKAVTGTPAKGTTSAISKDREGQPGAGTDIGKTAAVKSDAGTQGAATDTFFDPKSVPPELQPAYKEMQRAFGKKMEAMSKDKAKIDAYDAFSRDPLTQIQQAASRMGYKLTRAEAANIAEGGTGTAGQPWEPKTWDEVIGRVKQETRQEILQEFSPLFNQVTELRKTTIEKILDDAAPDWRQYEDEMKSNIQAHPSLVNDPVKLYRISIPPEILESRATQAALKKLEEKVKGAHGGGSSSTTKHQAAGFGDKPLSFNEAVMAAKANLAERGIKPPAGG